MRKRSKAARYATGEDLLLFEASVLRDSGLPQAGVADLCTDFLMDHIGATLKGQDYPEVQVATKPPNDLEIGVFHVLCTAARFACRERNERLLKEAMVHGVVMAMRLLAYDEARRGDLTDEDGGT
jgi:hypothetical protein